ncbi:uncharacterized protein J8A68_000984, partial [[Candida] subhashii]
MWCRSTEIWFDFILFKISGKTRTQVFSRDTAELEQDITLDELKLALSKSSNQSAPGEDGVGYRLYKMLWDKIGPLLVMSANEIMATGQLPSYFQTVIISLIPKPEKDDTFIQNYRPISLINCGLRLISGVLNNRLQKALADIITYEQVGFMSGRHIDNNIQKLKYVYEDILVRKNKHAHILLLDFEKAFDRVSHRYMEKVLKKIRVGPRMRNILMSITTQQRAKLRINNFYSRSFPLHQGTRQGNPVSPLLFNICLEPFLYYLTQHIRGYPLSFLPVFKNVQLLSYADDLTVFINDTTEDVDIFWNLLCDYEKVSNARINVDKTMDYSLSSDLNKLPFPHKTIGVNDLRYLGVDMQSFSWKTFTDSILKGLWNTELTEAPIHLRALGFNTYIFSKLYFRDIHCAMASHDIKYLKTRIKTFFKGIGYNTLTALPTQGGFGLLDLGQQLKGRRAKYVWESLSNVTDWNFLVFRSKLQQFVNEQSDSYNNNSIRILTIPWFSFLTRLTINYKGQDIAQYIRNSSIFNSTEKAYLSAWFELVRPIRDQFVAQPISYPHFDYLNLINPSIAPPLPK